MIADRYRKDFIVTWDQLHRDTRDLSHRLVARDFKGLIAVTRGGLIPAGLLARELNLRWIDTLGISSYDLQNQRNLTLLKGVDAAVGEGEGYLLVDDLVDTGKTARVVRELLPRAWFVTLYAKPEGRALVDDFITEVSQDTWIRFPWDMGISYVEPVIDQHRRG